jgi:glycerol uptake facilitator-like aquaporin
MTPGRRLAAEFLGTALLLAAVVGSGIMGDRLSGGNVAIALLANTIATGATLVTLILRYFGAPLKACGRVRGTEIRLRAHGL